MDQPFIDLSEVMSLNQFGDDTNLDLDEVVDVPDQVDGFPRVTDTISIPIEEDLDNLVAVQVSDGVHFNDVDTNVVQEDNNINSEATHYTRNTQLITKGKRIGQDMVYFKCTYCDRDYQGPSTSSILKHLRKEHPRKCSELLNGSTAPSKKLFFEKRNTNAPFNEYIFTSLLLKWTVRSNQSFSNIDNKDFHNILQYLKKDLSIISRPTLMRRLKDRYELEQNNLKDLFRTLKSKFSITCDIWSSLNQLSFFGVTVHYVDANWEFRESLLAFKFLDGDHDGLSLSLYIQEVLVFYGIADRLLGITADNATNNSTMMMHLQAWYSLHHPENNFSVEWNQVQCVAHVMNLGIE